MFADNNPVLARESRGHVRHIKSYLLLTLYIVILGMLVAANFPGGAEFSISQDGGQKALGLLGWILGGQLFLILALVPPLATGAITQERERQTLEPLLLSPLTPMQIVWGKAGGVLSLVLLFMVASVPLTSICFLLGGLDPGLVILGYSILLGVAVVTTGCGVFCASAWPGPVRSLVTCYMVLPLALGVTVLCSGIGSICAGLINVGMAGVWVYGWLHRKLDESRFLLLQRNAVVLASAGTAIFYATLALAMIKFYGTVGLIVLAVVFVLSYLVTLGQWAMLQSAQELLQNKEPRGSMRQRLQEFKADVVQSLTGEENVPYVPGAPVPGGASASVAAPTFGVSGPAVAPVDAPDAPVSLEEVRLVLGGRAAGVADGNAASPDSQGQGREPGAAEPPKRRTVKSTYDPAAFIKDGVNPFFARDARGGLLGGGWLPQVIFRLAYGITILTQVALLLFLIPQAVGEGTGVLAREQESIYAVFVYLCGAHFAVLLVLAAWFGSRSIAPEKEGQTLIQLFTVPTRPSYILKGKFGVVLAFTLGFWVLAIPALFIAVGLDLFSVAQLLPFVAGELVLAILAGAWGTGCSFACKTVRQATTNSILGTVALALAHCLPYPLADFCKAIGLPLARPLVEDVYSILPWPLVMGSLYNVPAFVSGRDFDLGYGVETANLGTPATLLLLVVYVLVTYLILRWTASRFATYARTEGN